MGLLDFLFGNKKEKERLERERLAEQERQRKHDLQKAVAKRLSVGLVLKKSAGEKKQSVNLHVHYLLEILLQEKFLKQICLFL